MPTVAPKVSVIVPCRNESSHIAACVAGLLALEAPAGGFEVVVADGMSDDGTREILARLAEEVAGKPADATPSPGGEGRGEGESLKSASAPRSLLPAPADDSWNISNPPARLRYRRVGLSNRSTMRCTEGMLSYRT